MFKLLTFRRFSTLIPSKGLFFQKSLFQIGKFAQKYSSRLQSFSPVVISKCDNLFDLKLSSVYEALSKVEKKLGDTEFAIETISTSISRVENIITECEQLIAKNQLEVENINLKLKRFGETNNIEPGTGINELQHEKKELIDEKNQLRDEKIQLYVKETKLSDKEKQLRDEKNQLRDKEKQLRDKENQLRDEIKQLRDELNTKMSEIIPGE